MTERSLNIIERLRKRGIQPQAFASSELNYNYLASNALDYEENSFFGPKQLNTPQYWAVDFGTNVILTSYQLKTESNSNVFYNWAISTSLDKITWPVVSPKRTGLPGDVKYQLNNVTKARFARLDAGSDGGDKTYFRFYHIKFFGLIPLFDLQYSINSSNVAYLELLMMILIIDS